MLHNSLSYIYPIFIVAFLFEAILICHSHKSSFSWQESLSSLGIALGNRIIKVAFGGGIVAVYSLAWQHRILTISVSQWWSVLLLFLGIEFFYYWHHRAAHQIRWLWATHAVHHSPQYFNLSAAYRLGWTGWLSGNYLFFLPLCWLGFEPIAITTGLALNLIYQFWIHTELIPQLGWLEWVLNTPSHHRVHHASNPEYIDRNYGGVLIVFDRLLGTYAEERRHLPLNYGLTHPLQSHNPVTIAFHEWNRLFWELITAKTWCARFRIALGLPSRQPRF